VHFKSPAYGKYPSSKVINGCNYVECKTVEYNPMDNIFGFLAFRNYNLGYIIINTFEGEPPSILTLPDSSYNYIDNILSQYKNKDGLIIDVRGNSGGVIFNSQTIASRFADKSRLYEKYCLRDGPGSNDFSQWNNMYISPAGPYQYTRPVVVLTSRGTGSTAECFVLAMKTFPQVTTVGDTTGGGFGLPIIRVLPNGWTYRISTAIGESASGDVVDGHGISPDITVQTSIEDSINGVDRILETGILTIEQKIGKN
jgi:C-terminal processing protease CtpA/Prc